MPKTTKPYNAPRAQKRPQPSETLGNTWLTDSSGLLGLLKGVLHEIKKNGKDIYKGLQQCGLWDSYNGRAIRYTGMKDGSISVSSVKRCDSPDCPVCQRSVASRKSKRLSKAFQENRARGGEVLFITATSRPFRDTRDSIALVQDFNSLAMKTVNNYTRRYDGDDKAIAYATVEGTYSRGKCSKDHDGSRVSAFYYVHTHAHLLVGIPERVVAERGTKDLVEKLKALWVRTVRKHGAYSKTTDGTGFRVDYADNADKLTSYVNKVFDTSALTAELTLGHTKKGKGYNLPQVLSLMSGDSRMYGRYRGLVRAWFEGMYGRRRNREYGINRYVELFEVRQRRYIEDYVRKRTTGDQDYQVAVHQHVQLAQGKEDTLLSWLYKEGWRSYFPEDGLSAQPITKKLLDSCTVEFVESVDTPVYNAFIKMGLEGTLERLFAEYHYRDRCHRAYEMYQRLNVGYQAPLFSQLVSECQRIGILVGSRARLYTSVF